MIKRQKMSQLARLFMLAALSLALAMPFFAAGCGGASTPKQAVRDFYKAVEDGDWNAYLRTILPENVRRMTESDFQGTKEQFQESDYQYKNLSFKTILDKQHKDRAKVELTSGTIVGTNPMTNKKESTTIEEIKKSYDITPSINVKKFKGGWYVDIPMASAEKSAEHL